MCYCSVTQPILTNTSPFCADVRGEGIVFTLNFVLSTIGLYNQAMVYQGFVAGPFRGEEPNLSEPSHLQEAPP